MTDPTTQREQRLADGLQVLDAVAVARRVFTARGLMPLT